MHSFEVNIRIFHTDECNEAGTIIGRNSMTYGNVMIKGDITTPTKRSDAQPVVE